MIKRWTSALHTPNSLESRSRYHWIAGCICRKLHFDCAENDFLPPLSVQFSRPDLTRVVSFQDLKGAVNAGCWFCSILHHALTNVPDWSDLQKEGTNAHISAVSTLHGVKVEVNLYANQAYTSIQSWKDIPEIASEDDGRRQSRHFEFYTNPAAKMLFNCKNFPAGRPVPYSTAAPEAYNFAKQMLRDCKDMHCCAYPGLPLLPKRVLKIEIFSGKFNIKLVENEGERGHYVSLSHCWGSAPTLTTTTQTLQARKSSIPLSQLPRTFLDAVHITSELGYHFLWIDSLCILQDNPEDWELESAKMNMIYLNCAVMISADHARDGNSGCFRNGVGISWKVSNDDEVSWIYCRERMNHTGLSTKVTSPSESPLSTRAWAFQERVMVPRILHYVIDEIIWECNANISCQCGAVMKDISRSGETYKTRLHRLEYAQHCILEEKGQIWHTIIQEYSGRALTKPGDRLPALSGLAKRFQKEEVPQDEQSPETYYPFKHLDLGQYLAGLWFETLSEGLCWRTFNEASSSDIVTVMKEAPTGPSWSWVSVPEAVYFSGKGTNTQIHGASCTPASLDPTGAVLEGQVDISGRAIECYLYYHESYSRAFKQRAMHYSCSLHSSEENGHSYPYLSLDGRIHPAKTPEAEKDAHEDVLALQMSTSFALLLRRSTHKEFQYERIGYLGGYPDDSYLYSFFEKATERRIIIG